MSTRGAYGFILDGIEKIAYNHFDSYPRGLGKDVVDFINNHSIEELKQIGREIVLVESLDNDVEISMFNNECREIEDYKSFLKNSLHCEWAYIINLDTEMLEIYKGFNQNPNAKGRYAALQTKNDDNGYYGVKLIKEVPLKEIENFNINNLKTKENKNE